MSRRPVELFIEDIREAEDFIPPSVLNELLKH